MGFGSTKTNSDFLTLFVKSFVFAIRKIKEAQRKRTSKRTSTVTSASMMSSIPFIGANRTAGRRQGNCYSCGKPGHWRSECLAAKQMEANEVDNGSRHNQQKISTGNFVQIHVPSRTVKIPAVKNNSQVGCFL